MRRTLNCPAMDRYLAIDAFVRVAEAQRTARALRSRFPDILQPDQMYGLN